MEIATIAAEYRSGGPELGRLDVLNLGWELLDGQLVGAWHAFADKSCSPCAKKEVLSCHLPLQL